MQIKRKFPKLILASDIIPRDMQWLWYPYIPMSAASMIFGPGGYGKSHITVDLAARLTTGAPLPGQSDHMPPRKVLMLSAEDEYDAVLVPRLIKAGADLTKVGIPAAPFILDTLGIRQIEEYMREFEATVVFIDPMVHYIGPKVDMNRMNEVRAVTGTLHQAAIHSGSAVIIVHHSRKGNEGQDFDKASGSADFNNAVRSVLFTTRTNDGTRVLRHVKSNYAALGDTLAYTFGKEGFEWIGGYDEGEFVGAGKKRNSAAAFIKDLLKDGPVAAVEVIATARDEGYNEKTLNRAKSSVAESYARRENGKMAWYWRLLGDERKPLGVPHGDFLNIIGAGDAAPSISSVAEPGTSSDHGRGPKATRHGPLDSGAPASVVLTGSPVADRGRGSRRGPGTDPLSRKVATEFSDEVARILKARGKL